MLRNEYPIVILAPMFCGSACNTGISSCSSGSISTEFSIASLVCFSRISRTTSACDNTDGAAIISTVCAVLLGSASGNASPNARCIRMK